MLVGSILTRSNRPFCRFGKMTKRGVEFHRAMSQKLGGALETECVNTRFPLLTLLHAGYRVKQIRLDCCASVCL